VLDDDHDYYYDGSGGGGDCDDKKWGLSIQFKVQTISKNTQTVGIRRNK
jgi:hypothetical protein